MSIEFDDLPYERFESFHNSFDGEGSGIWRICNQCGGRCEIYKVGTLMPGEKEYIARQSSLSVIELENRYLDRLTTPRGTVDVLKFKQGCPFLDACYHCTLADKMAKPVLCEVYPVVFEVERTGGTQSLPELQVRFLVDELDCPLMHATYNWGGHNVVNPGWEDYRSYFQTVGIERLQQMEVPAEWYWIVAQYDNENFDYDLLERSRRLPVDQYDTFTLDQLMSCSISRE